MNLTINLKLNINDSQYAVIAEYTLEHGDNSWLGGILDSDLDKIVFKDDDQRDYLIDMLSEYFDDELYDYDENESIELSVDTDADTIKLIK